VRGDFAAREPFFCETKALRCQKQIRRAELFFSKNATFIPFNVKNINESATFRKIV
jgi:hypothetical protein